MKHTTKLVRIGLLLILTISVTRGHATPHQDDRFSFTEFNIEETQATIKKTSKGDMLVYTFPASEIPEQHLLDATLTRFRRMDGFVSLELNASNQVELVTKAVISEEESNRLLAVSAKIYGYTGFNITE